MLYYVFYSIAAVNFAAFLVSLILYTKESIKCENYRKLEEYIRSLEIENLKQAV
ncbi:MAG: hypothetical protein Q4B64_04395 [Spirochaetales bacterium]|nr:hypothetical protein [Spirochaetales bacterium]